MDSKATRISPTMDNFCQNFKLQFRTKSTKIYQEILQKYRPLSVQLRKYSLYVYVETFGWKFLLTQTK